MKRSVEIKLVDLQRKHFPLFIKWWNDRQLRYLTSRQYKKISQSKIFLQLQEFLKTKNRFDFILQARGVSIGHLAIQKKKGRKYYELFIAIGEKAYWDKGLGTVAVRQAMRWFFKKFKKERFLTLEVLPANFRAIRCYQKVGFKKVRIKRYKKYPTNILMILNKIDFESR